jgi:hypothetical protein
MTEPDTIPTRVRIAPATDRSRGTPKSSSALSPDSSPSSGFTPAASKGFRWERHCCRPEAEKTAEVWVSRFPRFLDRPQASRFANRRQRYE